MVNWNLVVLRNAEKNIESVHFPDGVHDYNYEKRNAVYRFMSRHLGLDLQVVSDAYGKVDERKSKLENAVDMLSFSDDTPFPTNALQGHEAIRQAFQKLR